MKIYAFEDAEKQTQFKPKTNPIYKKAEMNVTKVLTKDYGNMHLHRLRKTNPIQTQFQAPLESHAEQKPYQQTTDAPQKAFIAVFFELFVKFVIINIC